MSQYVIYSPDLKNQTKIVENWIIRHDPFPLQLVPVCASTTIFIGLESQPSRGFPAACSHIGTPFPFRSRISLRSFFQQGPLFVHRLKSRNQRQKKRVPTLRMFSPKGIQNFQLIVAFQLHPHLVGRCWESTPQDSSGICVLFIQTFQLMLSLFTAALQGHVGEVIKEVCVHQKYSSGTPHFLKSPEAFAGPAGFGSPR